MTTTGGETKSDPSGWTVDTVRIHLGEKLDDMDLRYEQRFTDQQRAVEAALAAQEKAVAAALAAADRAVAKAEAANERRFESQNEFRGQLTDQAANQVGRLEHDAKYAALVERFDRADQLTAANTNRLTTIESRSGGLQAGWGYLVGVAALAATIIGVVLALASP